MATNEPHDAECVVADRTECPCPCDCHVCDFGGEG